MMLTFWCAAAALAAPLRRIVVAGGTHGNEYTGVYVLQQFASRQAELANKYPSLSIETLLANPEAHAANRRFIDCDLNRQFSTSSLADDALPGYEAGRAKDIAAILGPKGPNAAATMCIDMHTTTANMGCTIIVSAYSKLAQRAAAYAYQQWDAECASDFAAACARGLATDSGGDGTDDGDGAGARPARAHASRPYHPLRVMIEKVDQADAGHLSSVARDGIEIEVGPTPQSLLRSDVVGSTERALRLLLRYLELHFSDAPEPKLPATLPAYVMLGKVPFVDSLSETSPATSSHMLGAVVAASLQDRDFAPLRAGEPLFEHADGRLIPYDGSFGDEVYPVFINEAAYYMHESGRGVGMSQRVEWAVPKGGLG